MQRVLVFFLQPPLNPSIFIFISVPLYADGVIHRIASISDSINELTMRHLLQKNLLFFTSSSSSFQPRSLLLLLRFHLCEFSSSPAPSYSHWKRLDDESRNVRVSVWWDFENCSVPVGLNVSRVAPSITDAVRANGIKGPVHITAFGDVMQLSKSNQESLAFTGIHLTHIPNGLFQFPFLFLIICFISC